MDHQVAIWTRRRRRHRRVRRKVSGTAERPRLCVYRSLRHTYCQIIDDEALRCVTGCSTRSARVREALDDSMSKAEAARVVGKEIARIALEKGIEKVAFDRAGYRFHGRIKALAEAARQAGLKF